MIKAATQPGGTPFAKPTSLVLATNDARTLTKFRSIITPAIAEVLSLADVTLPEPSQDGRDARESTMLGAAVISSRAALPTVAIERSFTIDPLFSYHPDPQLSHTRDYPTWTWRIPPRERTAEFIKDVNAADKLLWQSGYCGPDDRGAYFLTTLCFTTPEGEPHFIEEWCNGQFYLHPDATNERGIDFAECLVPTGHTETMSKLDSSTRASLSDFRKAVQSLATWLALSE